VEEMMHAMVTKTMQLHVLPRLVEAKIISINFDVGCLDVVFTPLPLQSIA
jgi:hypothetical protein